MSDDPEKKLKPEAPSPDRVGLTEGVKEPRERQRNTDLWRTSPEKSAGGDTKAEASRGIDRDAWKGPGKFHVETDRDGNTKSIEGWLHLSESPRTAQDSTLQRRSKAGLEDARGSDGGHIIAISLGGPRAALHAEAKGNIIPMDSRINRSFLSGVESRIRNELAAGKQIYVKAEVSYKKNADGQVLPVSVTHRFYERGQNGRPRPYVIAEVTTRVDTRPAQTAGEAVKPTGDKSSDFYAPKRKGVYEV